MIEIVLDTETTGVSVEDGHRIVEIGCIELKNQIPTGNFFHSLLNPGRKVSNDAFKIHGYSNEFLSKQKKFNEIANDFLTFINNKNLVIHNADFDLSHLNNELKIIGKVGIKRNKVIDTLELARKKFPGLSNNLDALCKRFRISNQKRQKHNALIDCELLSKVYINLIDQKEPSLDFSSQEDMSVVDKNYNISAKYSKKIIRATNTEIKLHNLFLKKELKKNYY